MFGGIPFGIPRGARFVHMGGDMGGGGFPGGQPEEQEEVRWPRQCTWGDVGPCHVHKAVETCLWFSVRMMGSLPLAGRHNVLV